MSNKKLVGLITKNKNVIRCLPLDCLTPTAFALFVFIFLTWLVFEIPYILPAKPDWKKNSYNDGVSSVKDSTIQALVEPVEPPPFLWNSSSSRNVSLYIVPGKPTYLLTPTVKCSPSTEVLFVVPSSVNNTLQRNAIRDTWGLWVNNRTNHSGKIVKKEMKLVFILGRDETWGEGEIDQQILGESQTHGDLIVENFIDSYLNLTLKSIFLLKWADMNCPNAKFVMKADDDMFINVLNLEKVLDQKTTNSPLLMGTLICNARPIQNRWSKWYTPLFMFSGKYPNYLSGTAYVISGNLVKKLLNTAIETPYFHLEDVYITGICAKKLGVRPTNHKAFSYLKRAFNPCIYKDIIAGHEVTPVQMKNLWNMLHNSKMLARCKPIPKKVLFPTLPGKCLWR